MARTKRSMLRPSIIFLIGIILIALSLTFWYFMVSPVVSLDTYGIQGQSVSKTISNASSSIYYFGGIRSGEQDTYNRSRPVDYSLNLSIKIDAKTGPINVTVYVRDNPIFKATTNATDRTIWCNATQRLIYATNNQTPPAGTIMFSDIVSPISVSLMDTFTGGTTPYMVIQNLNTTSATNVSYIYNYTAMFRNSDGLPLVIFVIGVIIVVAEGVVLLRFLIRRVRER